MVPVVMLYENFIYDPGLWIRIRIRIGSGFNDFVDPDTDPHRESGSRIRGKENEEK
jgi:hypothetical protein